MSRGNVMEEEQQEQQEQEPSTKYMNVMCELDQIKDVNVYLASRPKSVPRQRPPTIARQISVRVATHVSRPVSDLLGRVRASLSIFRQFGFTRIEKKAK